MDENPIHPKPKSFTDGWMRGITGLRDELMARGLVHEKTLDAIYDHFCNHYDTLDKWQNESDTDEPPPLPPLLPQPDTLL